MNIKFCFISLILFFIPLTSLAKKAEFKELENKKELKLLNKRVEGKCVSKVFDVFLKQIQSKNRIVVSFTPVYEIIEYYSYSYREDNKKKFLYKKRKYKVNYGELFKLAQKEKRLKALFLREQKYFLGNDPWEKSERLNNIVQLLFWMDIRNKHQNKNKDLINFLLNEFRFFELGPTNSKLYKKALSQINAKQEKNSFIYTLSLKVIKKLLKKSLALNIKVGNITLDSSHFLHIKLKYVFRKKTK